MLPTMSAYEANRDINRAMGLPWHDRYTHAVLIDWFKSCTAHHIYPTKTKRLKRILDGLIFGRGNAWVTTGF